MIPYPTRRKHAGNTSVWLLAYLCSATAILLFVQCASLDSIAGTGSQAGNGRISCVIHKGDGTPASGAMVLLRRKEYLADTNSGLHETSEYIHRDGLTDKRGFFSFDSVDTGNYNIEVNDGTSHAVLLSCSIAAIGSQVNLPDDTLHPTGALNGAFTAMPGYSGNLYIQVYGLERVSVYNAVSGKFLINNLPHGSYTLHVQASSAVYPPVDIGGVSVTQGTATDIGNIDFVHLSQWRYSRRICLNTAPTGADIAGTITNFPVLVRLRASNFDFSQANADGGDVRFTKADGTPLPYEIARWDALTQTAEVWVKADTIRGNDSVQYITMYWGDPSASPESIGRAVFDSAGGFEGVWHLNETSGTRAGDASGNGITGTYKGWLPNSAPAPLGICQQIVRPDSDYVDLGNVLNPGMSDISVGVWVKMVTFGKQQALITKSNGDGPSATYGYLLSIDLFNFPHFYLISGGVNWGDDGTFDVSGNQAITDSTMWHYVFVTVDRSDNSRCKMYLDGIDRTGTIRGNISRVAEVANVLHLRVGTENDNNYSFKGSIGEASIAFTTRSADWVKLAYMNQKADDNLVALDKK
jgi:hypothetical protein